MYLAFRCGSRSLDDHEGFQGVLADPETKQDERAWVRMLGSEVGHCSEAVLASTQTKPRMDAVTLSIPETVAAR